MSALRLGRYLLPLVLCTLVLPACPGGGRGGGGGGGSTNEPPVASAEDATTDEEVEVEIILVGEDPDPGDEPSITFDIVDEPTNGTLVYVGDVETGDDDDSAAADDDDDDSEGGYVVAAIYSYTPATDFFGEDSFSFQDDGLFSGGKLQGV